MNHKPEVGKKADVKSFRQKLRAPQVEAIEEALEGLPEDDAPRIAAPKNRVAGNIFESDVKNEHVQEEKREHIKVNPRNDKHSDTYVLPGTFDYDSDWFQTEVNLDDDDNNNDVYAFSAHYDASDTVVRVVALTPTFQTVPVFCRLENNGQVLLSVEEGKEVKMKDHHDRSYTAAVILCKVHKGAQPARLAVLQDKSQTPTKYMKVNYPKKEHHAFSVCVTPFSPVYWDAHELVQNTELGIILGAEHFTFYVQSASGPVPNYLEKYQGRGVAEVLPWSPLIDEVHAYGQIAAIQDCLFRNKATSDYILFQDINEIFMPLKHKSWKDLIEAKLKHKPKVAAIVFLKSFFPLVDAKDLAGIEEYYIPLVKKYKLYVLSNPWRESKVWDVRMRSKFIVIPNRVVSLGIVNNVNKFKDGYTSMTMDTQEGLLYQYQGQKDESKPLVMDTSARRFASDLIERVAEAWNDEK
ncbi:beta-1,4-galactosyltransferase galt-1-like [Haliotis rubra]|uniref:beta-1,4-galactosyltransferase galt-1-like n=1 Tax=Haliotis rubra TaxID=36100 RepID=UPI001EE5BAB5|nr:beta-1,4-galactosyltransferase galt-1-like [Haliotis rubra]